MNSVHVACLFTRGTLGHGFALLHIDAHGAVYISRPMRYHDFARYLRQALVTTGVDPDMADEIRGTRSASGTTGPPMTPAFDCPATVLVRS